MKKTFVAILALAVFLRFFLLGMLPVGLSWDEAAIGYNGYGIVSVHRDEWLVKMPVTFKSFGDYKAATAIYLDAVSTKVFGLTPFGIRFPMAAAGVVTVLASYAIASHLFKDRRYALFVMLLVAVSPLNIHYSRIAFESGIAVCVVALAVACYLHAKKNPWILYPLSAAFFVLSMYTYHSTKISAPLIVLVLFIHFLKRRRKQILPVVFACLVGVLLLFPLVKETIQGKAGERFYMTSALLENQQWKSVPEIVAVVVRNTVVHFSPGFLLFGESSTYRHGNNVFGVLGHVEFLLMLPGVIYVCIRARGRKNLWVLALLFVSLLPAVISNDAPHSNRAHGIIPWVQLLAGYGLFVLEGKFSQHKTWIMRVVVGCVLLTTVWYAIQYARVYSTVASQDFQYGYLDAVSVARQKEADVSTVLFTSAYGQPYIYVLMAKKLTPIQWQQGALSNYELRDISWESDKNRKDTLIVGTGNEITADAEHIIHEIKDPNDRVVFRIVENP